MTKYGATETEAERLVDRAYENPQPYSARAKAFPSNPSIGQTCVIDVRFTLTMPQQLLELLVKLWLLRLM